MLLNCRAVKHLVPICIWTKKKSRPLSGLGPRLLHSWPRPRAGPGGLLQGLEGGDGGADVSTELSYEPWGSATMAGSIIWGRWRDARWFSSDREGALGWKSRKSHRGSGFYIETDDLLSNQAQKKFGGENRWFEALITNCQDLMWRLALN
jgi:hypothetical protein